MPRNRFGKWVRGGWAVAMAITMTGCAGSKATRLSRSHANSPSSSLVTAPPTAPMPQFRNYSFTPPAAIAQASYSNGAALSPGNLDSLRLDSGCS